MARSEARRTAGGDVPAGGDRAQLDAAPWWLAAALAALDDHVYFGLLHVDGRYENLFAGPNLERFLGAPLPDSATAVVAAWKSRIEPADMPAYLACEDELRAGRPGRVDYRVHGFDGQVRWIRARVHPEQLADGSVRFAGILSDVTMEHEADDRLRSTLAELAAANAMLDSAHSRALELARTDALTGAANRRHAEEALHAALDGSRRTVGVVMLDLDDFKAVNDRLGHRAGDEVLVETVARLRRSVRPDDLVARWGGEEFLIVCRDTGGRALARLAQRARAGIAGRPFATSAGEIAVTASVGAIAGPGPARNAEALVDAADAALLAAKGAGKDRVVTAGAGEAPGTAAAA